MALSGAVLLIACLNIANMLLARGRRGGRRLRFVSRSAAAAAGSCANCSPKPVLAFAGAAGGLLLAYWTTGLLAGSLAIVMPLAIEFDARPDLIMAATTAFAMLGDAALRPRAGAEDVDAPISVSDLKELTRGSARRLLGRRFTARNSWSSSQIALSLMLMSAGGLFARGALNAASPNPGFSYDGQLLRLPSIRASCSTTKRAGARPTATCSTACAQLPGVDGGRHGELACRSATFTKAIGRARRRPARPDQPQSAARPIGSSAPITSAR